MPHHLHSGLDLQRARLLSLSTERAFERREVVLASGPRGLHAMRIAYVLALCLGLAAPVALSGACAPAVAPVALNPEWPTQPGAYEGAYRDWTRSAILRRDYQEVLKVFATFKSPAYRAAYAAHKADRSSLTAAEAESLQTAEKAAAAGAYEVQLLVTTWDFRENDLHKGQKSLWRVALTDDRGNEVLAESIARDRRPRWMLRAEFPDLDDFAIAYVARFPRTVDILRPDAKRFSVEVGSSRGAVTLTWQGASEGIEP